MVAVAALCKGTCRNDHGEKNSQQRSDPDDTGHDILRYCVTQRSIICADSVRRPLSDVLVKNCRNLPNLMRLIVIAKTE